MPLVDKGEKLRSRAFLGLAARRECRIVYAFAAWAALVFAGTQWGDRVLPGSAEFFQRFLRVPHPDDGGKFMRGAEDYYLIVSMITFWTLLRFFLKHIVFHPLALLLPIRSTKRRAKFLEISWFALYYSWSFTFGYYNIKDMPCYESMLTPLWFNHEHFWIGYPFLSMPLAFKLYYLGGLSFWSHSLIVVLLEPRKKDFWEMWPHHVFTIGLMGFSWWQHFTPVGIATLFSLDLCDVILHVGKALNYCDYEMVANVFFGVFAVTWLWTRHVVYFFIVYSIFTDLPRITQWRYEPEAGAYASPGWIFMYKALFAALQVLMVFWFYLIVKMIIRTLRSGGVEDDIRSSDEEEDGEPVPRAARGKAKPKKE